jgi:pSer/pThr/pTyr-binding forkhead associated (FHA) protein/tetratricopeptide (TPR) repeat protein
MKLIIEDDEGRKTVVPLVRDEISIGRLEGNTIRLTERNVSRKHARLLRQNGSIYIEDLGSYNGVRVNGEKITARSTVKEGDLIEIGDYDLAIEGAPNQDADTNPTVKEGNPHLQAPSDKTPPLAVPAPTPIRTPTIAPPQAQHLPPAAQRKTPDGATAMIRLSDLQTGGEADELRDLDKSEAPRIVGLAGSTRGKEFTLRKSVMKFGRTDDGNDIVIDHQSISRQHGKFQMEGGAWKIYDNKSANGLRVNGDEYGMASVKPGDTIELGHVKFRFVGAGEAFTLPKDAPAASASSDGERAPATKSKMPLIIGGAVGALVLIGVIVVFATSGGGTKTPAVAPDQDPCVKGQAAVTTQNWGEAVKQLSIAKSLAATCTFPLDQVLETAKKNNDAKESLEAAKVALDAKKYSKAISALKGVAADSMYSTEAMALGREAKENGARDIVDSATKAIDGGKLTDAKSLLDELANFDPENTQFASLTQKYNDKKKQMDAAKAAAAAPPPKPMAERNANAEKWLGDANGLIKGGDLQGGISLLQKVIAEAPDKQFLCKAYRNMGVANARGNKTDEAVKNYKLYLNCDPNAPEKAKLQQIIGEYEAGKH